MQSVQSNERKPSRWGQAQTHNRISALHFHLRFAYIALGLKMLISQCVVSSPRCLSSQSRPSTAPPSFTRQDGSDPGRVFDLSLLSRLSSFRSIDHVEIYDSGLSLLHLATMEMFKI